MLHVKTNMKVDDGAWLLMPSDLKIFYCKIKFYFYVKFSIQKASDTGSINLRGIYDDLMKRLGC